MERKELTELIIRLADAEGVSGNESRICSICADIMKKYTKNVRVKGGNVLADFGTRSSDKPHVLIDAHIDRVGLIVTSVTEDGFIKADCLGGLDRRLFPAQRVVIHGTGEGRNDICGVICTLPPHLKSGSKVMEKDQIYIDPVCDKKDAKKHIMMGDTVSFDSPCRELLNGRISGAGLDDRCGAAAIIKAVDDLGGNYDDLPYTFTVMFSAQEELGERGACIGAFEVDPDIAIAVDVSFALSKSEKPSKCGEMSKGCMIGIAPSLSKRLSDWFIGYAKKQDIPFQYEVMNGNTGTNADRFSVNKRGSEAVTLSIPLRYMHTPAEVIDVKDCELTAKLITAFLKEGNI